MPLRCKIELVEDPKKGWKAIINDDSSECLEALKKLESQLNIFSRGIIKERLETSSPKVEETLKKIGLS